MLISSINYSCEALFFWYLHFWAFQNQVFLKFNSLEQIGSGDIKRIFRLERKGTSKKETCKENLKKGALEEKLISIKDFQVRFKK